MGGIIIINGLEVASQDTAFIAGVQTFDHGANRQRVIAGFGALERVVELVVELEARRPFVLVGSSSSAAVAAGVLRAHLSSLHVAVGGGVQPHAPFRAVRELAGHVRDHGADVILAVGGGTVIDAAKGIALTIGEGRELLDLCTSFSIEGGLTNPVTSAGKLPIIAVPTTLSGSEMTPGGSITTELGVKRSFWDPLVTPRGVLLDPRSIRDTPDSVLLPSAINSLAHAAEALYSRVSNPFASSLALSGARQVARGLAAFRSGDKRDETFLDLLVGAALAGRSIASARVGLSHAFCHAIGAHTGVSHGLANAVMLPPTLAFNAEASEAEQQAFASALEPYFVGNLFLDSSTFDRTVAQDGLEGQAGGQTEVKPHEAVRALVTDLGLPSRLREIGVRHESLAEIAENTATIRGVYFNPRVVEGPNQLLSVLELAW